MDTLAYITQPLDILGKRKQRIAAAGGGVNRSQAEYELVRAELVQRVKLAYWAARGAQETRDLLKASAADFQQVVDYHAARLKVGAISEQDFLRVRLEAERLQISANLAAIEATRTRVQLFKEMGQTDFGEVILSEPLADGNSIMTPSDVTQVLSRRPSWVKVLVRRVV